jgi:hypothetical protein
MATHKQSHQLGLIVQDHLAKDLVNVRGRISGTHRHALVQNLRRGHYELGMDARCRHLRVAAAFDELAVAI